MVDTSNHMPDDWLPLSTNTTNMVATRAAPIGETLHRLLHAYKRAMQQGYIEAGIDLNVSQIRVLKSISGSRERTAQDIAGRMRQDKSRIARLLKRLATDGLITREPHPDDHRSQQLRLTNQGRALLDHISAIDARAGVRMAGHLSDSDMRRFIALAESMMANLEQSKEFK